MATRACDFDPDSLLPPRKRLLAGLKKQNSNLCNGSSPISPLPCFASSSSSSSTSNSNGSSSSSSAAASPDVQTHLDDLLSSQLNDHQIRSPDELAQASRANAALAVKIAKAARATANEKAIIASKAVDAAKSALEFFASFPAETKSLRKYKQKKHVPVRVLYSKDGVSDEDLARRLDRAINNSPRVLRNCSGHKNKKQKIVATYENSVVTNTMYNGHDVVVAGVVDSDSSKDDNGGRVNGKLLLCDSALNEKTWEESGSTGRRRGRVKLIKKLSLSMCVSKDQENEIIGVSNPLAQPEGSNGGVAQVRS